MIFKEPHLIPEHKWQTRRPVKPGDKGIGYDGDILCVYRNNRLLWQVGKTYAKQPGRGKKAVGRTPPIKAIRRERLQEISDEDCLAEGIKYRFNRLENAFRAYNIIDPAPYHIAYHAFRALWGHIYRKPYDWRSNPDVWCLIFERVEETGKG